MIACSILRSVRKGGTHLLRFTGVVAVASGLILAPPALPVGAEVRPAATVSSHVVKLIDAARAQVGVTLRYDPAYVTLAYPGGDVPEDRGVCTDVIVRAYRRAFAFDLQKAVHEDMRQAFASYPQKWGLKGTDRNIDHRRVPNLQTFFTRRNASLSVTQDAKVYLPGDLVTQMLPGNLPHIGIVSDRRSRDGSRPLVIHNIGSGAKEEDTLFAFPITGHYRLLMQ